MCMNTAKTDSLEISKLKHSHSFGQDQKQPGESRTLIVIAVTGTMMVVEIIAGIAFGSMALLADGIHMASHAVALSINAFAYIYARHHANNNRFSFGTGKVNALGGFTGAALLAMFALLMAFESVERFFFPTEIVFNWAIGVAIIGLVVNGVSVFILGHHSNSHHHDHQDGDDSHDHNLRSAYLHVLADALTSVTAIFALLAAKYFGLIWMDPLMGLVGSALVAKWSFGLLKSTSRVLLDQQAESAVFAEVQAAFPDTETEQCYDLHVWQIAPGKYGVILGLVGTSLQSVDAYKQRLNAERFPHVTIELCSLKTFN